MVVKVNCLINAPSFFTAVWSWLKVLFSKEIQETVKIFGRGHSDLLSSLRAEDVPACYGGDLTHMPQNILEMYGLDVLLDRDPKLSPFLYPGDTSRLARFHLPPASGDGGGGEEGSGRGGVGAGSGGNGTGGGGEGPGGGVADPVPETLLCAASSPVTSSSDATRPDQLSVPEVLLCAASSQVTDAIRAEQLSVPEALLGAASSQVTDASCAEQLSIREALLCAANSQVTDATRADQLSLPEALLGAASSPVTPSTDVTRADQLSLPEALLSAASSPVTPSTDAIRADQLSLVHENVTQLRQALAAPADMSRLTLRGEGESQMLARFLRGAPHRGSVPHAVERLTAYLKWREEKGVSAWATSGDAIAINSTAQDILGCDPATIASFLPHARFGVDRVGRPVLYKHLGRHFIVKSMVRHSSLSALIDYNCFFQEQNLEVDAAANMKQWLYVIDLAGFHLGMFDVWTRRVIFGIAKIDETFYPDMMGAIVFVNAPPSFALAWRVMRTWMDPSNRNRTHIISERNPEQAMELLTRLIDPSQLPANYGGYASPLQSWPDRGGVRRSSSTASR